MTTSTNRAKNRRVEIIVLKSKVKESLAQSIDQLNKDYESVEGQITDVEKQ